MMVTGGATEPTGTASYYTENDPVQLANKLASIVTSFNLDGIDIDWY
jgi:hypothetical protein